MYALFLDKFERLKNELSDLGEPIPESKLVKLLFAKADVEQMGTNVLLAYVVESGIKSDGVTLKFAVEKLRDYFIDKISLDLK